MKAILKSITGLVFLMSVCFAVHVPDAFAYNVVFNTKTYIYHIPACEWARKCTIADCICENTNAGDWEPIESQAKLDLSIGSQGGGKPAARAFCLNRKEI